MAGRVQQSTPVPPEATIIAKEDLSRLVDALHGWQLQQQCDFEDSHLHRYKTQPVHEIIQEVHADIQSYLQDWEILDHSMRTSQRKDLGETYDKVVLCRWHWVARRCYSLVKDFKALRQGSDAFLSVYVDCWS
jgi:hypothetical protein